MSDAPQSVRTLQTLLRDLSRLDPALPPLIPDGIFGEDTRAAVLAFQRSRGLMPTGTADHTTWQSIVSDWHLSRPRREPPRPVAIALDRELLLGPGDTHAHLPLMQTMLSSLAGVWTEMPAALVTGTMDEETRLAVAYLQEKALLPVTGRIDREVWDVLSRAYTLAVRPEAGL